MASGNQMAASQKASWDMSNTGIFLQLLVEQIDAGNRPSGHFTKPAWTTITTKFVVMSGCNFTVSQLKNKWDNMKKEFSLWEKLLHDETGLGYDHVTSRILADPAWWHAKLQEKPEYKKFKTHGPLHLDLQEKVFRGVVATGYMEYYPDEDAFLGDGVRNGQRLRDDVDEQIEDDDVPVDLNADDVPPVQTERVDLPSPTTGRKRKICRTNSTKQTVADVNRNMNEVINVMREESVSSVRIKEQGADEYAKAIQNLRNLPWLDNESDAFATLVLLLEDPTKRVTFSNIMDLGERVVTKWIASWEKKGSTIN